MIAVWVLLSGCLAACRRAPGTAGAAAVGSITNYTVGGLIRELKPDGTNVIIRHEAIRGYMEAMTMSFDATNPAVLHGLKTNDVVRFQYESCFEFNARPQFREPLTRLLTQLG